MHRVDILGYKLNYNMVKTQANLSVFIETHGCKLNQADAMKLANEFQDSGFTVSDTSTKADVYILNTCTVTHVADSKARHSIRSFKKQNSNAKVIVTGCYAERAQRELELMPEIDIVMGNMKKKDIVETVIDEFNYNYLTIDTNDSRGFSSSRTRAMLKIQEGCNQICSYCIVPKVRGREKSISLDDLVSNINSFTDIGFKEVVLTGTQLGSYGFDLEGIDLTKMISGILENTDIERLRISSLQPQELTQELISLWEDDRLCPHFHIPLQSGNDYILGKMRRKYTSRMYLEAVENVRNSVENVSITTDVIVGFPGETQAYYEDTRRICEMVGFADMHVFKFSSRPGTSAAYYQDDVVPKVKNERSAELISIGQDSFAKFRQSYHGKKMNVLWETTEKNIVKGSFYSGLTSNYIRVTSNKVKKENSLESVTLMFNTKDPYGSMDIN